MAQAIRTEAGMFCLWQPEYFTNVTSQEIWEDQVSEDAAIVSHVAEGALVPINLGVDGAFQFVVRGGDGDLHLTPREMRYLAVSSEPYLLVAQGPVALGGLEAIGSDVDLESLRIPLEAGRYEVTIRLLDWSAEPGSMEDDGSPGPNALPDFIVEIRPAEEGMFFRTKLETFDHP